MVIPANVFHGGSQVAGFGVGGAWLPGVSYKEVSGEGCEQKISKCEGLFELTLGLDNPFLTPWTPMVSPHKALYALTLS